MNEKETEKLTKIVVNKDTKDVSKFLIPKPCSFELIRIGGKGDGAYLVPDDLNDIDACFSPGVANRKDFEDELTKRYGIKCHMCDFSSETNLFNTPLIKGMQTFKRKWLDIEGVVDSISLKEWVQELSPDKNKDLILQIDIEGSEYRNLLATEDHILSRFRIIIIELHRLNAFKNPKSLAKEVAPLLQKLDGTHISIHAHPNNCCGEFIDPETGINIPNVLEVTYLRKDRFIRDRSKYKLPQLPHPLDISRNVMSKPPIHLNKNWLKTNKRSMESEIKVLSDNLHFEKWEKNFNSTQSEKVYKLSRLSLINLLKVNEINFELDETRLLNRQWTNLSFGKKYFLTNTSKLNPPGNIVKDDLKFFFHTAFGINQSITIDLGDFYKLNYLVISNRADGFQDRAKILFLVIHGDKIYSKEDAFPVIVTDKFLKPNGPNSITPLFGKTGRYLTIFSPIYTALHFSSIKVL